MDTLLQNTFHLHSKLNKSLPGATHPSIHANHTNYDTPNQPEQKFQQQLHLKNEESKPIGLGLDTPLDSTHRPYSQGHIRGQSNGINGPEDLSASLSIPSSPIKSSFSSPQLPRIPSDSTIESIQDQEDQHQSLSQGKDQFRSSLSSSSSSDKIAQNLSISTMTPPTTAKGNNGTPYARHYSRSLSAGVLYQQHQQQHNQQPHHSPQPHTRRNKTSLSALANIDHNGKFVHPHFNSFNNVDPKDDTSTISLNIRFVSKGLWVRVDIPRNSSVQVARDLVLEKCQLTMTPPSAPSSVADTVGDDDAVSTVTTKHADENRQYHQQQQNPYMHSELGYDNVDEQAAQLMENKNVDNSNTNNINNAGHPDPDKTPTPARRSRSRSVNKNKGDFPTSHSDNSITDTLKSNGKGEKDVRHSHSSLNDIDFQRKHADTLVSRLDIFHNSLNGFGDEVSQNNYVKVITSQSPYPQGNSHGNEKVPGGTSQPNNPGSTRAQIKRLWSNNSNNSTTSEDQQGTSPPDRVVRDSSSGTGRLGNLPGWGWGGRSNDSNDNPDILLNCPKHGSSHQNDISMKDCEAWKSFFGLFWVASGHWLDESRTINSYSIKPLDVLELQLRNHYIQLPPAGSNLDYFDHYAEGVLYKLSKKNRPDINHWERIFTSLNSLPPLSSPYLGGFGSPNLGSDENSASLANTLSGYPSERKRNHTITNAYNISSAATVPAINPVLISNAKAAISSITGGRNSANASPPTSLDSHYKSMNQNGGFSSHKPGDRETSPQYHPVVSGSSKDDVRRRAITEPNRFRLLSPSQATQQQHHHGNSKNSSKPSTLRLNAEAQPSLDCSNHSEFPFQLDSPPGRKRRPVLGTEYLDNASQILLASSSARSSTAPLYSGYIWIYLPYVDTSTPQSVRRREIQKELDVRTLEVNEVGRRGSTESAESNKGHTLLASPISPLNLSRSTSSESTSADKKFGESGRYVKCFALISDQGHFQWVQVKKQNNQELSDQELQSRIKGTSSPTSFRSSYGVQLKPSRGTTNIDSGAALEDVMGSPSERKQSSPSVNVHRPCDESVQVSMMESVNMYFFCVKISADTIKDVLLDVNNVETTSASLQQFSPLSTSPYSIGAGIAPLVSGSETNLLSPQSQLSPGAAFAATGVGKAASKIRHRLSSSLSTLATSATAASKPPLPGHSTKHQSMSGSISKGKNMTWPSISPSSTLDAESSQDHSQYGKLSMPERAVTIPPTGPSASTRSVTNKSSYASLKVGLPNITTDPGQYRNHDDVKPEGDLFSAGMTPTHMFASPLSAGPFSPPTVTPSSPTPSGSSLGSSSSSTSNIVSLAQNLQDVIGMAKLTASPEQLSTTSPSSIRTSPPNTEITLSKNSKPRVILSEAVSANQSGLPESAAASERSKQSRDQRVLLAEERVRAHEQQLELARKRRPNQQSQSSQRTLESQQGQQSQQLPPKIQTKLPKAIDSAEVTALCPFLELIDDSKSADASEPYVILRGYTESEDEWKALQFVLDRFIDGPINKHPSALPPQDTLIPSYHSPVEVKLSEKAERFLHAKESMIEEANLAASKAAIEAARSPTPDVLSGGVIPTVNGPVAQIRATSVSMTRWMNLSGGKDRDRVDRDIAANKVKTASKLAYLGDISPNMPAASTSNIASMQREEHGASIKRGISPAHSLSVGSGSSLFRPRPRLSQQRSADELSKTTLPSAQARGQYERETGSIEGDPLVCHENKGLYSAAAATIYSNSDCAVSNNNNNSSVSNSNSSGDSGHLIKSILKGKPTPLCDEEDLQNFKMGTSPVSPKMEYSNYEHGIRMGVRSHSESATGSIGSTGAIWEPSTGPLEGAIWEPSTGQVEGATITTAATADDLVDGGAAAGGLTQLEKREEYFQLGVRKRDSKSSIHSLYTHAEQLAMRETDKRRIKGVAQNNVGSLKDENAKTSFDSLPQESVSVAQLPEFLTLERKDVGQHPLEDFESERNGSTETSIKPSLGNASSSGGKKHQTVLGASKAAMTGVFGKIRKSV
ncbi:hypothetical protein BGZ76_006054, partial [Entomortierella beljakovae]